MKNSTRFLSMVMSLVLLISMTGITVLADGIITLPEITSFSVPGQVSGTVYAESQSIKVIMPSDAPLSGLTPTVVHNGESYFPAGAQDFSFPLTYSVTSAAGTRSYDVATIKANELVDVYTGSTDGGEKQGSYADIPSAITAISALPGNEYTIKAKVNFGDANSPVSLSSLPAKAITFTGTGSSNENGFDTRNTFYLSGDLTGATKLTFAGIKVVSGASNLSASEVHLKNAVLSNVLLPEAVQSLTLAENSVLVLSNAAVNYAANLSTDASANVLQLAKPEGQTVAKLLVSASVNVPSASGLTVMVDGQAALNDILLTSGINPNANLTSTFFTFNNAELYPYKSGNNIILAQKSTLISSVSVEMPIITRGSSSIDSGDASFGVSENYEHYRTSWTGFSDREWIPGEIPVANVIVKAKSGYSFASITPAQIQTNIGTVTIAEGQGAHGDTLSFTITYPMIDGHDINVSPSVTHGTITPDVTRAITKSQINLTITPDVGYRVVPGSIVYTNSELERFTIKGTSFEMPYDDVTLYADFEPIPDHCFDINIDGGITNGTITTIPHTARFGETVYVNVTPNDGYRLSKETLTYNGYSINNGVFIMPDEEVTVSGFFEAWDGTYTLKIKSNSGGRVTTGTTGKYAPGTEIVLETAVYSGYAFNGWTTNAGGTFASTSSTKTKFTMPDNDVTITANFRLTGGGSSGSGGGGTPVSSIRYIIYSSAEEGGNISPAGSVYVSRGAGQTFNITPNIGYRIKDVLVNNASVGAVDEYTFSNVSGNGNIKAIFESTAPVEVPEEKPIQFADIENHWAKNDIAKVVERGFFSGVSDTEFAPELSVTRAMFVTVLGRLHKAEIDGKTTDFNDVPSSEYYAPYVAWAAENNIVNGTGNNEFSPNAPITREQMAVIIYNYLKYAKISLKETNPAIAFNDASLISSWATDAVSAIQKAGLINGRENQTFDPMGTATRAEAAAIMNRLSKLTD